MKDSGCGMEVGEGAIRAKGYSDVASCCEHGRKSFLADPAAYLGKDPR